MDPHNSTITWHEPREGKEIVLKLVDRYGVQKAICDLCGSDISIGLEKGEVASAGGYIGQHRGTESCRKASQRRNELVERARTKRVLEGITGGEREQKKIKRMLSQATTSSSSVTQNVEAVISRKKHPIPAFILNKPPGLAIRTNNVQLDSMDIDSPEGNYSLLSSEVNSQLAESISSMQLSSPVPSFRYRSHSISMLLEANKSQDELSKPATPPSNHSKSALCQGAVVTWQPGSVWDTYPYQAHQHRGLPWKPVEFLPETQKLRIVSTLCKQKLTETNQINGVCRPCAQVPNTKRFKQFMETAALSMEARDSPNRTRLILLSQRQLYKVAKGLAKKIESLSLRLTSERARNIRLQAKVNDHQQLLMYLSTNNIPGLRHLLYGTLKRHRSPRNTMQLLSKALGVVHCPDGIRWSERDFDLASFTLHVGGSRTLKALSTSNDLPSERTIRRSMTWPHLVASSSIPNQVEMDLNIATFLGEKARRRTEGKSLVVLQQVMIDDLAIEERISWEAGRNVLLGLCREHSPDAVELTSHAVVDEIAEALYGEHPSVHHGKEATVLAMGSIGDVHHYAPVPLVLSSTCKQETGLQLASWVALWLERYHLHPEGEKTHGAVASVATDGASTFRSMRFTLFMAHELTPQSNLYPKLRDLPGLNLCTGPNLVLGTCDPKHVIKRFATLVRSRNGIRVDSTRIFPQDILDGLTKLPGLTMEEARQLMDPADKQNVPKAVNLAQSLLALKDLNSETQESLSPSQMQRIRMITFVAEVFNLFVEPFANVSMDINAQVESLCTYAHITAVMFRRHRAAFFGGALYADSQAIVKNIIFTVAKLQLMSPDILYFIAHEGSDRLENLFSETRTQDHNRNFDLQQLQEKMSIAAAIHLIYERQPDLYHGHRKRMLVNAKGVDHTNPASWVGEIRVGQVDLAKAWAAGRKRAVGLVNTYLGEPVDDEFTFCLQHNTDFLRPFGEYVGTSIDPNESILEDESALRDNNQQTWSPKQVEADNKAASSLYHMLEDTLEAAADPNAGSDAEQAPNDSDAILNNSKFFVIKGKAVFKSSYVAARLKSAKGGKSVMRTLRARGTTIEECIRQERRQDIWSINQSSGIDLTRMHGGEVVGCLCRVKDEVGLMLVEVVGFESAGGGLGSRVREIDLEALEQTGDSRVVVVAQILDMAHSLMEGENEPEQDTPVDCIESDSDRWIWTRQYLEPRPNESIVKVSGPLVWRLEPAVVQTTLRRGETEAYNTTTWSFKHADLRKMMHQAWESLNPTSEELFSNISLLPSIEPPSRLPYKDSQDLKLIITNIPANITVKKLSKDDKVECKLCKKVYKIESMRKHVGRHLLCELRDAEDELTAGVQIGANACGWCGVDGCSSTLKQEGKVLKILSNCPYHYEKLNYAAAKEGSASSPCTNIPIFCTMCPKDSQGHHPSIWKYNALYHLLINHTSNSIQPHPSGLEIIDNLPPVDPDFIVDFFIDSNEEQRMKIPQEVTRQFRERWSEKGLPGTEDINERKKELKQKLAEDFKRAATKVRKIGSSLNLTK